MIIQGDIFTFTELMVVASHLSDQWYRRASETPFASLWRAVSQTRPLRTHLILGRCRLLRTSGRGI
jgi:hypothetical protein